MPATYWWQEYESQKFTSPGNSGAILAPKDDPVYNSYHLVSGSESDLKIPGTGDKLLNGFVKPSGYTRDIFEQSNWTGLHEEHEWSYGEVRRTIRTGNISNVLPAPDFPDHINGWRSSFNAINRAETEALNKIRDHATNYGTAMAESKKTVQMINRTGMRLFSAYKAARQGDLAKAARILRLQQKVAKRSRSGKLYYDSKNQRWHDNVRNGKEAASKWLEMQYGWLPLASDIYGAFEDLKRESKHHNSLRFHVVRDIRTDKREKWSRDLYGMPYSMSRSGFYGTKVRLDYEVTDDFVVKAHSMGLSNPAEIAWELVPFSFLVDWALPIGNWLSAIPATLGLNFLGGSQTSYRKFFTESFVDFQDNPHPSNTLGTSGRNITSLSGGCWQRVSNTSRTVYSSSPSPSLYVKNPISTTHALNALALLRGFT